MVSLGNTITMHNSYKLCVYFLGANSMVMWFSVTRIRMPPAGLGCKTQIKDNTYVLSLLKFTNLLLFGS